ncbi:hypothetical protein TRV_08159, partial [Trichophyton verrucosum HKI 0517]
KKATTRAKKRKYREKHKKAKPDNPCWGSRREVEDEEEATEAEAEAPLGDIFFLASSIKQISKEEPFRLSAASAYSSSACYIHRPNTPPPPSLLPLSLPCLSFFRCTFASSSSSCPAGIKRDIYQRPSSLGSASDLLLVTRNNRRSITDIARRPKDPFDTAATRPPYLS